MKHVHIDFNAGKYMQCAVSRLNLRYSMYVEIISPIARIVNHSILNPIYNIVKNETD